MRAVGDTIAEACTPGGCAGPGCNNVVIRAKVARGLSQINAAVGQLSAAERSSTTTAARVAVNSRRLRDSDKNATERLSAFASVPTRSTSVSALPRSSQPNRTASSPSETAPISAVAARQRLNLTYPEASPAWEPERPLQAYVKPRRGWLGAVPGWLA